MPVVSLSLRLPVPSGFASGHRLPVCTLRYRSGLRSRRQSLGIPSSLGRRLREREGSAFFVVGASQSSTCNPDPPAFGTACQSRHFAPHTGSTALRAVTPGHRSIRVNPRPTLRLWMLAVQQQNNQIPSLFRWEFVIFCRKHSFFLGPKSCLFAHYPAFYRCTLGVVLRKNKIGACIPTFMVYIWVYGKFRENKHYNSFFMSLRLYDQF